MTMDILETLLKIEKEATLWLFSATPGSDAERAEMQKVLALCNTLHGKINEVVLVRLRLAATDIAAQKAALEEECARIQGTAKQMSTAQNVIGIVAKVIEVLIAVLDLVL